MQFQVNALRTRFQARLADWDGRKAFVALLARFVRSFHFLTCFFTYPAAIGAFATFADYVGPQLVKAGSVSELMHYADRKQEHFLCASINGANEILNIRVVSIGLIDRSPVHPREVFADALADRASAVIVAHNHPSGGLEPSPADLAITAQLKAAGAILGIELLDHIIFNRAGYFSFLEAGTL